MIQKIDARGKQCPIPLIEAKKAVETPGAQIVEVLVDNEIAVQNLLKMTKQKGLTADYQKAHDDYLVRIIVQSQDKPLDVLAPVENTKEHLHSDIVVVLSSNRMGQGDDALGKVLMKGFLYALTQQKLPKTILLYNSGVKLSAEDTDAISDLTLLQEQGVEILSCGTCLNHYQLTDQLAVGEVTNMYTIVEKMNQAGKLIKP